MFYSFSEGAAAGGVSSTYRCTESVLVLLMIGFACLQPARAQGQAGPASTDAPAGGVTK